MMKYIYTIILFILACSQVNAQSNPAVGLKEISLTGLSTADGSTFHIYSADGKLNRGFSEVFIALTDKNNDFVADFTVSDFRPINEVSSDRNSTPVGKVERVVGKSLYKTWFSFLLDGSWSLSFNYTIGGSIASSAIIRSSVQSFNVKPIVSQTPVLPIDTITQIGWFKDRNCVGAVTLPLTKSCGIGCGTGTGGMASCWNSGLGVFIYNAAETGIITKAVAQSNAHFLLFDAQSKELTRAFLLSLPTDASGKLSVKVTGYWVANGISANSLETYIPELNPDSVIHYLNAFHLLSIEGVVIENQAKSYAAFAATTYKLTPQELAPSNLSAVNYTGGTTLKFTPPANAGKVSSNLTGYKVRVYNTAGLLQDQFTTIGRDVSTNSIDVPGFIASADYSFTVAALYPGSGLEVESAHSSIVNPSITGLALSVDDYPEDNTWIQSFTYNNESYFLSVAYPKLIGVGKQTVRAYINKQVDVSKPYSVVEGGFNIVTTPFMRSMGHSSSGNTDLAWDTQERVYKGTLNFSMAGDWRVNLKIFETSTNTLVTGVDLNPDGDNSTDYWDFYLDKAVVSGLLTTKSNEISVYPSFTRGDLTIEVPSKARVRVLDLSGKVLEIYQLFESQTVHLTVPSGFYLVSVESLGNAFIQKVTVQK